nr:hypothetical protein [Gammaproteobacteria bacterium]
MEIKEAASSILLAARVPHLERLLNDRLQGRIDQVKVHLELVFGLGIPPDPTLFTTEELECIHDIQSANLDMMRYCLRPGNDH